MSLDPRVWLVSLGSVVAAAAWLKKGSEAAEELSKQVLCGAAEGPGRG